MAQHIRKNADGSSRILSATEAAAEDKEALKAFAGLIPALALTSVVAFVVLVACGGNLDTPLSKVAIIVAPILGFVIGWKIAKFFWIVFGLAVFGGLLWFLGNWIFS